MRLLLVIAVLLALRSNAQVVSDWKSLPTDFEVIEAITEQFPAKIVQRLPRQQSKFVQERYHGQALVYQGSLLPDTLPKLEWEVFDMPEPSASREVGGMIFKDHAESNIRYLDLAHGLFSDNQGSIAQDAQGLIYTASSQGLSVYNGKTVELYEDFEFFSFKDLDWICGDSQDRIWIGSRHGLGYVLNGKFYCSNLKQLERVWRMREDKMGNLWVCSVGLGALLLEEDYVLQYYEGLGGHNPKDAYEDAQGNLWIAQESHALVRIKNDSLFIAEGIAPLSFLDDGKDLWIGCFQQEFMKWRNDSLFVVDVQFYTTHSIFDLHQNEAGIWGTSYAKGAFVIKNNGEVRWFYEKDGLASRYAYGMMQDDFGNIWVGGLQGGFSRIDQLLINRPVSRDEFWESEVEQDSEGNLWQFKEGYYMAKALADECLFYGFSNEGFESKYTQDGIVTDTCVWSGNMGAGIAKLKDEQYTLYMMNERPLDYSNFVSHLESDEAGGIWFQTIDGQVARLMNDQFQVYSESGKWPDLKYVNISKTRLGKIAVVMDEGGAIILHQGQQQFINIPDLELVEELEDGRYLAIATGRIIIVGSDGTETIHSDPFLENNSFEEIQHFRDDIYLLTSSKGLLEITVSSKSIETKGFGVEYGPKVTNLRNISIIGDQVYLGNSGMVYDPSAARSTTQAPLLSLKQYDVDTVSHLKAWEPFSIDQQTSIKLTFNNISWGKETQLRYRLVMNGVEQKWNAKASNFVEFETLPFGEYQLQVYATDGEINSKPLIYEFSVLPHWHQTWWATTLGVLLLLLGFIWYILRQRRRAKKIEKRLQELVDQQTVELKAEKEEVSHQLSQKELLLKEVTHRVKNNMQMVSAILELQSFRANDEASKKALEEGISRINSLAMAHQNLYRGSDFVNINLGEYLGMILNDIMRTTNCEVVFDVPDDYNIDIEKAQALGFILNELLTNSTKYAWPTPVEHKKIQFSIVVEGNSSVATYCDNGVGFKEGYSLEGGSSLGSVLIASFVQRQLEGSIETMNENGAKTIIKYSKDVGR